MVNNADRIAHLHSQKIRSGLSDTILFRATRHVACVVVIEKMTSQLTADQHVPELAHFNGRRKFSNFHGLFDSENKAGDMEKQAKHLVLIINKRIIKKTMVEKVVVAPL
jgi:hypothetical protein